MSTQSRVGPPPLPRDRLERDGWSLVEDEVETLFRLSAARVEGRTQVYEDGALRDAVRAATGIDHMWRFVFATRVSFTPSLAPGIAPLIRSRVASEARTSFAEDLLERGFEQVAKGEPKTAPVRSGARADFTPFKARYHLSDDRTLDMEGFLAVWHDDGFLIAGGAYPAGLEATLATDIDTDPDADAYREELLDIIRSVGG
ncbi:MAG: hypothetical protein ABEJ05_09175 [Haloglomus sp.]